MQMVLHSSNSRNNSDRYILNLGNTVPRVLKKKQDKDNDELTEMQTSPGKAGSSLLYNKAIHIGKDLWTSPNQIICS